MVGKCGQHRSLSSSFFSAAYLSQAVHEAPSFLTIWRQLSSPGTPKAKIHKTGAPCNLTDAPTFSAFGCGSPLALVSAAVEAAANATLDLSWPSPDFVLFTGDNTRHNSFGPDDALEDIREVQKLFREYFPGTPLVKLPTLDLGNNDFPSDYYINVTSHEPCLPTVSDGSETLPAATNEWLKLVAEQQSDSFVSELQKATFACGGYMNHVVNENLSIIVLNTVVWDLWHEPVPTLELDKADPFGQFAWLRNQFLAARDAGRNLYITGHIPPMLQSYTGSLGLPLYKKEKVYRLWDIITEFDDVVAGVLFAHLHSNELRHIPTFSGDAPPMLIGTSIAPCYTTNPGFRIVKYDRATSRPLDMASYFVNLSSEIPDNATNPFTVTIPSLIAYLGMSNLTNDETLKLADKMMPGTGDEDVWNNYFNHWYKGVPQTQCNTPSCQRSEACLVACGNSEEVWDKCNASTSEMNVRVACGLGGTMDNVSQNGEVESSTEAKSSWNLTFVLALELVVISLMI
ncbi:hypothetical protein ACHAWF_010742 [Thalassiosira exigua]